MSSNEGNKKASTREQQGNEKKKKKDGKNCPREEKVDPAGQTIARAKLGGKRRV